MTSVVVEEVERIVLNVHRGMRRRGVGGWLVGVLCSARYRSIARLSLAN